MNPCAQNTDQKILESIFLNYEIDDCIDFFYKKDYRSDEDMKSYVRSWYDKAEKIKSAEKFCQETGVKEQWRHKDIFRIAMLCCGEGPDKPHFDISVILTD